MNVAFKNYLKSRQASRRTIETYEYRINQTLRAINKPEEKITHEDLEIFLGSYGAVHSSATVISFCSILGQYFNFLNENKYIKTNPAVNLSAPYHVYNKPKPYISFKDVQAILAACGNIKEKAIISLIVSTGIRMGELAKLTLKDYNSMINDGRNVLLIYGKGNKPRSIYFNDETIEYINEYINSTRKDGVYLFTTRNGGILKNNHLNGTIRKVAKKAELPYWENVTCHSLRAAAASIYSERGIPVAIIRDMLGHSSISTTSRYIKTNPKQVEEAVTTFSLKEDRRPIASER